MKHSTWAAAALGAAAALALAGPASADHNSADANLVVDGCTLTATSVWELAEHTVANTVLVVRVGDQVTTAAVGEPLDLELAPGTTAVDWRVWGGGERNYDNPPLDDLAALLAYLEDNPGGELDADAPGVAWHTLAVADCAAPVETTPPASPSPTPEPSASPTVGTQPSPAETEDAGAGGELPTTGAPVLLLGGVGAGLLVAGGGAVLLARRRVRFTA